MTGLYGLLSLININLAYDEHTTVRNSVQQHSVAVIVQLNVRFHSVTRRESLMGCLPSILRLFTEKYIFGPIQRLISSSWHWISKVSK